MVYHRVLLRSETVLSPQASATVGTKAGGLTLVTTHGLPDYVLPAVILICPPLEGSRRYFMLLMR